ncbi:hypothetical protein NL676_011790 [Syzygium grande]|nr:hypothetical protein NL676_011790 [Syzygium grande]
MVRAGYGELQLNQRQNRTEMIVCLTDLEIDYINQYDAANRINKVVLPEFVSQGVLCFFYLVTGCWFMFLLSLPYLFYNIRL